MASTLRQLPAHPLKTTILAGGDETPLAVFLLDKFEPPAFGGCSSLPSASRAPVTVHEPSTVARSGVIKRTCSIDTVAWKALPMSAFAELSAVLLFGLNLAMSLTTPIPSWFGRKQANERMSIYWLVASYPATRRLLVEHGLITLAAVENIPKTLSLREAAQADGISPSIFGGKARRFL